MKKNIDYNIINSIIILITLLFFVYEYKDILNIFENKNVTSIIVLVSTVLLVHFVKAARLYLALYGLNVDLNSYVKTYCKVTPTSIVIPFKLGEVFRMYCYGQLLQSPVKGVIIILLDRFMDTIALVTAILLAWILFGGHMTTFVYILLIFLVFVLFIYFVYPSVYKFWKSYLLKSDASEHKLAVLKMLEMLNMIYKEIESVAKGRGIILYFMSLVAWGVEIGSLILLNEISRNGKISQIISDYLTSAMKGNQSTELKQFVIVSVALFILVYIVIKVCRMTFDRKKVYRDEDNCYL